MRESPAVKLIQLLRTAGADVSYHDPHVPTFDGMSSAPLEPEEYDCVVDRHRPLRRSTTATSSSDAKIIVDFRNATGPRRARCWKRDAIRRASARSGLGYWGKNLARNFDDARRSPLALRRDPEAPRPVRRALSRTRARPVLRGAARRRRARRRRDRDTRPDALRAREAGARGRQARLRREAAGDARRRDGRARRALRRPRPRPDAGPSAALPPRREQGEGARRRRGLGDVLCIYGNRAEPRHDPQGRERPLVARRARPLGDPPPRSARTREFWARGNAFLSRGSRTSSSASCASRAARSPTCTSPGSTRTRCAS